MASGDPQCGKCGRTLLIDCLGDCNEVRYDWGVLRTKNDKLTRLPWGISSRDDLESAIAEYMGDEVFAKRFADCIELIRAKNADYSQAEQKGDRIAAFRRIARDVDVPMTKVWAVLFSKHHGAVVKFIKDGYVESEPIDGRINDIINYFVLLGAIIEDLRGSAIAGKDEE